MIWMQLPMKKKRMARKSNENVDCSSTPWALSSNASRKWCLVRVGKLVWGMRNDPGAMLEPPSDRWTRTGHTISGEARSDAELESASAPFIVSAKRVREQAPEEWVQSSWAQHSAWESHFQCFFAYVFPATLFGIMIRTWASSTEETENVPFSPCGEEEFKAMLTFFSSSSEAEFPLDGGREPLFGRQRSFQTIEKLKVSCDYLHRQAKCNASPTQAPENAQILKTLASAYCPTGAESYDMAEALCVH